MSLTRNLLKLIFVYCPVIIVLLGLGCFVNKNIKILSREAAPFISEIASDYLEIPCEVKSITLKGASINIKGLSAKDQQGNDLISAENIYIRLNPTTFTAHKIAVATIKAENAKANIYRTDKKWNFEFLTHIFAKQGVAPTDVRGPIIIITDSEIRVRDNVTKYTDSLKNVNIRMDLRSNDCPKISASLSSDYGDQVRLKTDFSKILHTADLSAEAKGLDLDTFNKYKNLIPGKNSFISETSLKGTADAKINIKIKSFKTISQKIEVSSRNLTAKTPYGTADKAQIYARLDNNILSLRTKGKYNKAEAFAEGSLDIKHPETVMGKIRLKKAEAENFANLLPNEAKSLKGTFTIDCSVSQGSENPQILCSIKAKNPSYNNIDLKELQFRGKLKNTSLDYELSAEAKGTYTGSLYAKGMLENFDLKKPDINKISSDSLINIRNFNMDFISCFKGSVNGDIAVRGNIAHPEIKSNLSVSRGFLNLKKVAFNDIYAGLSLSVKEDILYADSGLIQGFYNTDIFFNGSIDRKLNGKAALTVSSLSLEDAGKDFNIDMGGKGALSAKITRKDNSFASDWTADIQNFRFKDQNLDHIQADFSLSDKALAINQCTLLDFPSTLQAKGYITPDRDDFLRYEKDKDPNFRDFSEDTPKHKFAFSDLKKYINNIPDIYFDMECSCNNYSTKNLFRRLKKNNENIKAIADFSLNAKGIYSDCSLKELRGYGNIDIDDLSLYDNPFSNITAEFKADEHNIYLTSLRGDAVSFNAIDTDTFGKITGDAQYDLTDGELKGNISVTNLNINEFRQYYSRYATVYGLMNINCALEGTLTKNIQKISCDAESNIPFLIINGKTYRNITLNSSLRDSDTVSAELFMNKEEQSLTATLTDFSIKKQNIEDLSLSVSHMSVNDVREIFYLSPIAKTESVSEFLSQLPVITGGEINATLNCKGNIKALDGNCDIEATEINADFDSLSSVKAKLTAEKGVINLAEAKAEGTEFLMTCSAFPLYDRKFGDINLSLENLPLERFGKYLNLDNIKGNLKMNANIKGDLSHPEITASMDIADPIINNYVTKRLSAPKISLKDSYINIDEEISLLLTDNNKIDLKGRIPLNILTEEKDQKINLELYAPDQDLDFLEILVPNLEKGSTRGLFTASVYLSGTVQKPLLSGNISINSGVIHTVGNTVLSDLNADISLENNEKNDLLVKIADISSADNSGKPQALRIKDGYIRISAPEVPETSAAAGNRNRRRNTANAIETLLRNSEISVNADFDSYSYVCRNFTPYNDSSSCIIDGNLKIRGSILTPEIYTENPLNLKGMKVSVKSGSDREENAILALAERKKAEAKLFTYNDASEYEEAVTMRDRNTTASLFNPTFDISLSAQDGEIRPPATIAKANTFLTVQGSLSDPQIKGNVTITDGRTSFQIARARFVKGSYIDFEYTDHTPKANMDIEAFSHVHYADKNGYDERYKINIYITGGLDDYSIVLESDPEGLTEQEIFTAFTGINRNTINAGDTLAKFGATTILSPIEDFFVEQLGFSSLGFEYSQNNYAIINIERSFSKKLYGSFYSNFYNKNQNLQNSLKSNISEWELKFGYKFNKQFRFNIGLNNNKESSFDFTYGIRF